MNKIHILFLVQTFYPKFDANGIIVYNIAKEFIRLGHSVSIIDQNTDASFKMVDCYEGIKIYRSHDILSKQGMFRVFKSGHYIKGIEIFKEIIKIKGSKKFGRLSLSETYFIESLLLKIFNDNTVDIVIPVCYPFALNYPVMKLKKRNKLPCKWIVYMQDPYATHHYYKGKRELPDIIAFEEKVLRLTDAAVVTDFVYEEFKKPNMIKYLSKISILPFPKIIEPIILPVQDDVIFDNRYINCIFLGRFNEEIRNPTYMFRVFKELKDKNFRLHVIGDNDLNVVEKYKDVLGETLELHGNRSKEAAINAILHGDILVNIGNSVSNQLPSKIFEYFSAGRPIVNFYELENCPTLKYLNKYPLKLNINQQDEITNKIIFDFEQFCIKNRNKKIDYLIIKEIYKDFTVEEVSKKFLQIMNNVVNIKKEIIIDGK
ncbi:MAG: glycosyltransferase [Clostridia bacterium]